ncbi:MAG: hypothetical protein CK529_03930 [Rhodospirillaceae bacterium]|nr:MAG: hypothetical protein CK529_03930 [Rhodospirillaceae bacterium]
MIQRNLENPLATAVLEGSIADGSLVTISAGEDGLIVNGRQIKAAAQAQRRADVSSLGIIIATRLDCINSAYCRSAMLRISLKRASVVPLSFSEDGNFTFIGLTWRLSRKIS